MPKPEVEEFAKLLIRLVRDVAIQSADRRLSADHAIARRWKRAAVTGTPDEFAKVLIPDVVDDTLFHLLHAIDTGSLKLSFCSSSGKNIDLSESGLGELAGWYIGADAWRAAYSSTRFSED